MKIAFTLAEILITLGIISIIAAMTLPQIIINYQKKEAIARLKKNYTIIQQAIKMSENDNEAVQYWDTSLTGHDFYERYIKKYFIHPIEISSTELTQRVKRKNLNGTNYAGTTYLRTSATHVLTNDGSLVTFNLNSSNDKGLWVGIDINGLAKPNTVGKDTFLFFFDSKSGLRPLGENNSPRSWKCENCTRDKLITPNNINACSRNNTGYWCAALIMYDLWEIKKDYPW